MNEGKARFTTFTVPFLKVGEKNQGIKLSDLNFTNLKFGNTMALGDNIWIWDASSWQVFFYKRTGNGTTVPYTYSWALNGGGTKTFDDVYPNGLPEGTSLYFKAQDANAKVATGSGEVESLPQVSTPLVDGGRFAFIGNPYPTAFKLSDPNQFEITDSSFGNTMALADNAWVWNVSSWQVFFYKRTGNGSTVPFTYSWALNGGGTKTFDDIYPDGLPVGSALYIKTKANSKLTTKEAVFKKNF